MAQTRFELKTRRSIPRLIDGCLQRVSTNAKLVTCAAEKVPLSRGDRVCKGVGGVYTLPARE